MLISALLILNHFPPFRNFVEVCRRPERCSHATQVLSSWKQKDYSQTYVNRIPSSPYAQLFRSFTRCSVCRKLMKWVLVEILFWKISTCQSNKKLYTLFMKTIVNGLMAVNGLFQQYKHEGKRQEIIMQSQEKLERTVT